MATGMVGCKRLRRRPSNWQCPARERFIAGVADSRATESHVGGLTVGFGTPIQELLDVKASLNSCLDRTHLRDASRFFPIRTRNTAARFLMSMRH